MLLGHTSLPFHRSITVSWFHFLDRIQPEPCSRRTSWIKYHPNRELERASLKQGNWFTLLKHKSKTKCVMCLGRLQIISFSVIFLLILSFQIHGSLFSFFFLNPFVFSNPSNHRIKKGINFFFVLSLRICSRYTVPKKVNTLSEFGLFIIKNY